MTFAPQNAKTSGPLKLYSATVCMFCVYNSVHTARAISAHTGRPKAKKKLLECLYAICLWICMCVPPVRASPFESVCAAAYGSILSIHNIHMQKERKIERERAREKNQMQTFLMGLLLSVSLHTDGKNAFYADDMNIWRCVQTKNKTKPKDCGTTEIPKIRVTMAVSKIWQHEKLCSWIQ